MVCKQHSLKRLSLVKCAYEILTDRHMLMKEIETGFGKKQKSEDKDMLTAISYKNPIVLFNTYWASEINGGLGQHWKLYDWLINWLLYNFFMYIHF